MPVPAVKASYEALAAVINKDGPCAGGSSISCIAKIGLSLAQDKSLPLRQDLLNLCEMIAERGLQGVMEYVQKTGGKGLPVLALVPSLAALADSPSESAPL